MILLARARSRTKSPDIKRRLHFAKFPEWKNSRNVKRSFIPVGYRRSQNRDQIKLHNTAWETPTPTFSPIVWNLARIEILLYFSYHFLFGSLQHIRLCSGVSMLVAMSGLKRLFTFFQLLQIFSTDCAVM